MTAENISPEQKSPKEKLSQELKEVIHAMAQEASLYSPEKFASFKEAANEFDRSGKKLIKESPAIKVNKHDFRLAIVVDTCVFVEIVKEAEELREEKKRV